MERRNAMALAVSMTVTAAVGALTFASLGGMNVLGFGSERHLAEPPMVSAAPATTESLPAVEQSTSTTVAVAGPNPVVLLPGASGAAGADPVSATTVAFVQPVPPSATAPSPVSPAATTPTPTTPATVAPTSPPTTAAPGNALPPDAKIPSDWPPDQPIPPVPPGCKKPVLEDDGVWNCDH